MQLLQRVLIAVQERGLGERTGPEFLSLGHKYFTPLSADGRVASSVRRYCDAFAETPVYPGPAAHLVTCTGNASCSDGELRVRSGEALLHLGEHGVPAGAVLAVAYRVAAAGCGEAATSIAKVDPAPAIPSGLHARTENRDTLVS